MGPKGVRLKRFETAVADLLQHGIRPAFVRLPPMPMEPLPPLPACRNDRKRGQLVSLMRCILSMLPEKNGYRIVDFGGGSGHLAIPLARLLPGCEIVVVDLKAASLRLLHQKTQSNNFDDGGDGVKRRALPNLYTFHGSIASYEEDFDVGVALHACGEASDVVLRMCGHRGAACCLAPCCVGKLNRTKRNPYVYQATGTNQPTVSYPQSKAFREILQHQKDLWDALAKAADYSDWEEMRLPRNATRRTAKALLETDRLLFLEETHGFDTALTRMDPWECSPKHDVLLAWKDPAFSPYNTKMEPDEACQADVELAVQQLLTHDGVCSDTPDWDYQEIQDMRRFLTQFMKDDNNKYVFPTQMGGRKRKLVHFVAQEMGLAHWCHGKTYAEKTVVVAKQRGGKTTESSGKE